MTIPTASRRAPGSDCRFCPRCGTTYEHASVLCQACGETLVAQGYCGVCEAHWPLAAGTPCPKHELELEASPREENPPRPRTSADAWVTVGNFADGLRAEAPRIRLEAEGIPTFVDGERMESAGIYPAATGGVKLLVPASLAAEARVLLAQTWSLPTEDDLDDAWDDLEPDPNVAWHDLGLMAVLVFELAPLLIGLIGLALMAVWGG